MCYVFHVAFTLLGLGREYDVQYFIVFRGSCASEIPTRGAKGVHLAYFQFSFQ